MGCFYQTRSASSMDQGSIRKTLLFTILPYDDKNFCYVQGTTHKLSCMTEIFLTEGTKMYTGVIFIWSLIHGSIWSSLPEAGPVMSRSHVVYIVHVLMFVLCDILLYTPGAMLFVFSSSWDYCKIPASISWAVIGPRVRLGQIQSSGRDGVLLFKVSPLLLYRMGNQITLYCR